jgi:glyoxylase-like metal-dependent hydrolase (beta-lactamase superfamily II)
MEPKDGVRIFRLHGRFDRVYVYEVDGLMIDCGPPTARRAVAGLLDRLKPAQAVLTHYHEQHSGNADLLNERGIVPYLHPDGLEFLKEGFPPQLLYRRLLYGRPPRARFQPLAGEVRTPQFRFQVLPLPGHCPGHVGLYEPEREWLFAGDLYAGTLITSMKEEEDLEEYIASYERIRTLPIRVLYASHIGSITDPKYLIENKWFNLTAIRDTIVGMKNRRMKFGQIKRAMRMKEGWCYYLTQGDFAKAHFITSVFEHLAEQKRSES